MLSISEFAKRIGVCSNTVRKCISSGKLIVGEHYLNVGRVYRFAWSRTCVEKLMRDLSPAPACSPHHPVFNYGPLLYNFMGV